jgi:hypothetical protein
MIRIVYHLIRPKQLTKGLFWLGRTVEELRGNLHLVTKSLGQGLRESIHRSFVRQFNHEFSAISHNKPSEPLYHLCNFVRLNCPPAAGAFQEFFPSQGLRSDEIDTPEPGIPPNLRRRFQNRGDRIVINPASAKEARANHLSIS